MWSNSLVVASFYGPVHSAPWWIAAVVSTAIPAFYCFTGGMRASLFTDVFQAMIKVCFLVAVVAVVGSKAPAPFGTFNKAGGFTVFFRRMGVACRAWRQQVASCPQLQGLILVNPVPRVLLHHHALPLPLLVC